MNKNLENQTHDISGSDGQKSLQKTLRLGYISLKVATLILLISYLLSGVFVVNPDENVIILRFGRVVGKTKDQQVITSGRCHWAWPKPIDEIVRVPVKRVRTIHSNYFWYNRDSITENLEAKNLTKSSNHLRPGIDGYLLTGDSNIMHAQWSISYLITQPVRYALTYKNPESVIRYVLHRSILQVIAQHSVQNILYGNIEAIKQSVQSQVISQLARINIGITVKNITFKSREPPQSTIPYFNKVIEASQDEKQTLNSARSYAQRIMMESKVKQAQILSNAEGYHQKSVASLGADKEYFLKILEIYNRAPKTALISLYSQTLDEVFTNVGSKHIIHIDSKHQGQEIRLMLEAD